MRQYWLQVDMEDLSSFDAQLADRLSRLPAEYLPMVRRTIVCSQPVIRAITLCCHNVLPLGGPS